MEFRITDNRQINGAPQYKFKYFYNGLPNDKNTVHEFLWDFKDQVWRRTFGYYMNLSEFEGFINSLIRKYA